jgi:hypothetical protein
MLTIGSTTAVATEKHFVSMSKDTGQELGRFNYRSKAFFSQSFLNLTTLNQVILSFG